MVNLPICAVKGMGGGITPDLPFRGPGQLSKHPSESGNEDNIDGHSAFPETSGHIVTNSVQLFLS